MRAGDVVLDLMTRDRFVVAYAHNGHVASAADLGIFETIDACELEVLEAATDEEHEAALRFWADRCDVAPRDPRTVHCARQLFELLEAQDRIVRIAPVVRFARAEGAP